MFIDNFYHVGILDISFVRQCLITMMIFNGVALVLDFLSSLIHSDDHDWFLPMIGTLSMMTVIAYIVKIYLGEYVNLDKL